MWQKAALGDCDAPVERHVDSRPSFRPRFVCHAACSHVRCLNWLIPMTQDVTAPSFNCQYLDVTPMVHVAVADLQTKELPPEVTTAP